MALTGSNRSTPGTQNIHGDHAEDENNYVYNTPNHLELSNWDNQQHHDTCPPQQPPQPSEMPPVPLPYPDPSEASERSSLLLVSPLLLPRKTDITDNALSMNMAWPDVLWNLCLAPAKKNGGVEPEEELEMREGIGLRRGVASPC